MLFSIVILTLWKKKQRFRELRYLTAGHPASMAEPGCRFTSARFPILFPLSSTTWIWALSSASHFKGNKPANSSPLPGQRLCSHSRWMMSLAQIGNWLLADTQSSFGDAACAYALTLILVCWRANSSICALIQILRYLFLESGRGLLGTMEAP